MKTLIITVKEIPGHGLAIETVPTESGTVTEKEKAIAGVIGYAMQMVYETIATHAKSGNIIAADSLSPIWKDVDEKLKAITDSDVRPCCKSCGKEIELDSTSCPHCLATDFET